MTDKGMLWIEKHGKIEVLAWFVNEASYLRFKRLISGRGLVEVPTIGQYSGGAEEVYMDGCWGIRQPTVEGKISDGR